MHLVFLTLSFALMVPFLAPSTVAANEDMVWQFSEFNDPDNKGRMTARLTFGIPETDAVQVSGICDATPSTSANFSVLRFGTDIGDLKEGAPVDLRFLGGGFHYALKGEVYGTQAEEGVSGVLVTLEHDNPLWKAFSEKETLNYLVPGHTVTTLNFARGRENIQAFVEACRAYAKAIEAKPNDQPAAQPVDTGSTITEKEAFESAKELGTIDAWEAFLKSFPSGFRADLARAYVKKLGATTDMQPSTAKPPDAAPPTAPAQPPLETVDLGPGDAPWSNQDYDMDEGNSSAYAASVAGRGTQFVTYCNNNKKLAAVLQETPRGVYPDFDKRMKQGLAANDNAYLRMRFANGNEYLVSAAVQGLTGDVAIGAAAQGGGFRPNGRIVKDMMSEKTMTLYAPPFSATFQLKEARAAICAVAKKCGAKIDGCDGVPAKTPAKGSNPSQRKQQTKQACGRGKIRVEGKCILRRDATTYCGPGYRLEGGKCVPGYRAPKPQRQRPYRQIEALNRGCATGVAWNA